MANRVKLLMIYDAHKMNIVWSDGMAREVIYRLESLQSPNPTIGTIQRYASALGLEISIALKRIHTQGV